MRNDCPPSGCLTVVLVDDHDCAREALVARLGAEPRIRVVGATADLLEAQRFVRDRAPHVALVDTRRHDDAGLDVIAALAALPPASRPVVVVHTSFFDAEAWRRSRGAGASEWLLKQIDVEVLFERLSCAVRQHLPPWRWATALSLEKA